MGVATHLHRTAQAALAGALLGVLSFDTASAQSTLTEASPPPMLADLDGGASATAIDLRNQALAMMGREDRILRDPLPSCELADADALDMIDAAARNTTLVIINEAQDTPRHRAFIADVAQRLIAQGYRTYAAETLFRPTESGPGAPRLRSGYYSAEPTFGLLLRQIREADLRLVAYDQITPSTGDYIDDINARESLRASNLINRVFLQNPKEKLLLHVTHAHNKEGAEGVGRGFVKSRQILWLAQRLKEILGVDPLTIDQTSYQAGKTGVCFVEAGGGAPPLSRDLYVAHGPDTFDRSRPTWRLARGQIFAEPPRALKRIDARVIIEARPHDEFNDTVPVDRILMEPGESIPLLLAPGRYKARAWIDGKWTPDMTLTAAVARPAAAPAKSPARKSRRKRS